MERTAIIGAGNLGGAIAQGLLQAADVEPSHLHLTRGNVLALADFAERGVLVGSDNKAAAQAAQLIILAVKPHKLRDVLREIAPFVAESATVVSVATGVSLADMQALLPQVQNLFRAMPNTAIAIQESMTCIAASRTASEAAKTQVQSLFAHLGSAIYIEENLMDAATVLGACGIAYALRYIRAATQAGIQIGFPAAVAQHIATQTVQGAASLLLELKQHPESEIDKVTTPQGCTIVGLNEMEHCGFSSALIKGVTASYKKIEEIK